MARCGSSSKRLCGPVWFPRALHARDHAHKGTGPRLSDEQIGEIAQQGVVYGLPLILMDLTRQVRTNAVEPGPYWAPVNQLAQNTEYHDASYKVVVRSNVDSLYTMAWLDLKAEPIVLSVPDTRGRFYLFQMLDMWTDVFASPGTRTTGSDAADILRSSGRIGMAPCRPI